MARRYRLLWLPTLAALLPCAFIGVIGYKWLALEREAAGHRSATAAQAAADALARDLAVELQRAAVTAARALQGWAADRSPFQPPPALPPTLAAAYLFDPSRRLIAPDYEAADQAAVEAYRRATGRPAWDAARSGVEVLEREGRTSEALAAAKRWLETSGLRAERAPALLALSRLAATAGDGRLAEEYASQIFSCCGAARDEYGLSFALYAAWRRAGLAGRAAAREMALTALARDVLRLIDRGDLGSASDQVEIELLSKKVGGGGPLAELLPAVARSRDRTIRQIETARAVSAWLAGADLPPPGSTAPSIGTLGHGPAVMLAAVARTTEGRLLTMLVDVPRLASWINAWSGAGSAFDLSLTTAADPAAPPGLIKTPLFAEAPAFDLVVRQRALDPAGDRRRQRLFAAAVVAGLVLTLLAGGLAVRDVSRELRTAALRSTFVASVTHELRTPLASIRLLAETLRWGRARPEATTELLDTIVEETDRLGSLVDNVLASSRIESGTRVYSPRLVSAPDVVRAAVRRFRYVLDKGGFTLVESIEDARLPVRVDPEALGQAVLNLLGNAAKYSGTSREIRVEVARADGQVLVSVADDGIGIPASEQARIFERFYRAPGAAAETTGAGLGLALVRHFAEAHGGGVSVRSRPGGGSTFSVSLPLADQEDRRDG